MDFYLLINNLWHLNICKVKKKTFYKVKVGCSSYKYRRGHFSELHSFTGILSYMYVLSLSRNLLRKNKQNEQWHQQTQVKFFHVTNKVSITKLSSHEKSDLFTRSLKTGAIENSVHIYVNIFFYHTSEEITA